MKPLLLTVLAAYVVAAIHSILAFVNKRRTLERITLGSLAFGFVLHTVSMITDWTEEGHYPLFGLRETLSFLAWTLVATYGLVIFRYRTQALGIFTLPLVAVLTFIASVARDTSAAASETVTDVGSAWIFPVHTTLLIFAYAAFFVVFISSVMYLLQERELKLKTFSAIFHRLPSLTTINNIATTAVGGGHEVESLREWARDVEETGGDPPEKAARLVRDCIDDGSINGRFLWIAGGLLGTVPTW